MKVEIELGEENENGEKEEKEYDDYEIDCAVKTLIKAEEIKKDSKLWPLVVEKLKQQKEAITSIAQLRKIGGAMKD
jgi:hypothetical protein